MDWTNNVGAAGEWFNQLPDGIQQTLIGAAGEVVAAPAQSVFSIVGKGVAALLSKKTSRDAEQQAIQTAIQAALGDALLDTLTPLAQTPDELRHAMQVLFGPWLKTPAVSSELAKVIAPRSETGASAPAPNLAVLEAVFTQELGFKATDDALGAPFAQIVADLVENFAIQAAWQPALRPAMQVRTARTTNVLLRRLAPLDLDVLIQEHYLPRVSEDSNLLPLVKSDPRERKAPPRLQQVFVDLRVEDAPELSQFLMRLGLPRWRQTQVLQALHAAWVKQQRNAPQFDERMTDAEAGKPATWAEKLAALDKEAISALAQDIHVDAQALTLAHHKLTPLEKLAKLPKPQMVLLGVPGSGKSTFTRRVAAVLAHLASNDALEPADSFAAAWEDQILAAFERRLLPVRVVMSQWAQHAPTEDGCAADLIAECKRQIGRLCGAGPDLLHQEVAKRFMGKRPTVFVLLDGLDEVTDESQRHVLLHAVRDFCLSYPNVPLLITCRERPWAALQTAMDKGRLPSIDLPTTTLQRLTGDAISLFVARWHTEMENAGHYDDADKSARCQAQLQAALSDPQRQELAQMAGTPLLLTMMVLVNYRRELPDSRVELYEELVNQLLFEWERTKLDDQRKKTGLEELLPKKNDRDAFQSQLNWLAFNIHDPAQHTDTVDIPAHRLRRALQYAYASDPDDPAISAEAQAWAAAVLALITTRSGLINEVNIDHERADGGGRTGSAVARDGESVYQFAHRTFQEYLAARWMAAADDSCDLIRDRIDQPEWREAILLAIGYQCTYRDQGHDQTIFTLNELWPEHLDRPALRQRILLLGEAYVHLFGADGRRRVKERKLAQKLQPMALADLQRLMQDRFLSAPDRLQAALLLDDLRDQLNLAPVGLEDFIFVPNTDFYVGRYPVTNRQFKRFVDAGGYGDARRPRPTWWSEQGWDYLRRLNWTAPRYFNDGRFNRPAQPVVGVSWYEAEAYCTWLNDPASGAALPAGTRAQLPTREQWTLAARNGQTTAPDEAVDYPWADHFDPALANTVKSNFGQTTPVDMYPDGATPAGICDLAGNVWEWTVDANPKYQDVFWVKGGSWRNDAQWAQASAAGGRSIVRSRDDFLGFRLVCVPVSHG